MLVQIEVELNKGRIKMIKKLTFGLVDQLCWLRNHDDTILKCSGVFIMGHGDVTQVDVEWSDNVMIFKQTIETGYG